jgi:hypothetical protein
MRIARDKRRSVCCSSLPKALACLARTGSLKTAKPPAYAPFARRLHRPWNFPAVNRVPSYNRTCNDEDRKEEADACDSRS